MFDAYITTHLDSQSIGDEGEQACNRASSARVGWHCTVGSHRKGMKRFRFLDMKTFVQDLWPKCLLMVCRQLA